MSVAVDRLREPQSIFVPHLVVCIVASVGPLKLRRTHELANEATGGPETPQLRGPHVFHDECREKPFCWFKGNNKSRLASTATEYGHLSVQKRKKNGENKISLNLVLNVLVQKQKLNTAQT